MKKDIKIIAEIGWNHMYDMNLAEKMIIMLHPQVRIIANFRHGKLKI